MSQTTTIPKRLAIALLSSALVLSACSSSSDSQQSSEDALSVDGVNASASGVGVTIVESTDGIGMNDGAASVDAMENVNVLVDETAGVDVDTPDSASPIPDPLVQVTTRVDFEITVPVYQSNALQVKLLWGDIDVPVQWVGDELWTASASFPITTEQLLTVAFNDNNGDIELGSYQSAFMTGANASESFQIDAEQFDTEQWDADEDGTSNLNELIAGTNPLVNEALDLEVRDTYFGSSIFRVSTFYEEAISDQRPYSLSVEELPPAGASFNSDRRSHVVTIDIDALGNGIFSDRFQFRGAADRDITTETQEGTRTFVENAVSWNGTYARSNSGAGVSDDIEFSSTTRFVGDQTWLQDGTATRMDVGQSRGDVNEELSYALVGNRIEDSASCEPVSGTVTVKITNTSNENATDTLATITKENDDELWFVRVDTHEGELIEQFLARSLSANFYCDFGDL